MVKNGREKGLTDRKISEWITAREERTAGAGHEREVVKRRVSKAQRK